MSLPVFPYLGLLLSVIGLDALVLLIYGAVSGRMSILPGIFLNHSLPCAAGLAVGALVLRQWLNSPGHFLGRLRVLPLLSGLVAGLMLMVHQGFLFQSGDLVADPALVEALPNHLIIAGLVWYLCMFGLLYGFFCHALVSGLVTSVRQHLWRNLGIQLPTRQGSSLQMRLTMAFLFTLVLPTAVLLSDFTWLWNLRVAQGLEPAEIVILDTTAAAVALSAALAMVLRGLLLSLRQLEEGQAALAQGTGKGLAVLSDDEVGRIAEGFNRMRLAVQEREFLRTAFSTYVGEDRSRQLLTTSPHHHEPMQATVMFTDIAGFTRIAETLSPDTLVLLLREYFAEIVSIIERHGGSVDNFVGDAIVAIFRERPAGLPHAMRALNAAKEIAETTLARQFNGTHLPTRIGLHTGAVLAGEVGSASRRGFSIFGDTVNVAARLEAANKEFGSTILISESTMTAAGSAHAASHPVGSNGHSHTGFRPCGSVVLRGRKEPLIVWGWSPAEADGHSRNADVTPT